MARSSASTTPNLIPGAGRVAGTNPDLPPTEDASPAVRRMLLVSLRLFAERGFHGTSVRDIAAGLDVKAASLYSLIESKEHILAELVRLGHLSHTTAVEASVAAAGERPSDQLVGFMDAHVRFHARWQMLAVVSNNELHCLSPEMAAPSLALRERAVRSLLEIVERGAASGDFQVREPFFTTAGVAAMGMRVANWFDTALGHDEDAVAAEYSLLALRAVGAPDSATHPFTQKP